MVGDGAATLVRRAFSAVECPQPRDALDRFLAIYNGRLLKFTRPYPGIAEMLATLAQRTSLALLTNKPIGPTREILSGLHLASYFAAEWVLGGDGPFPRKPDPAGLRHLAAAAGALPLETVLVGDSPIDWRTARAAGARICLVRYGFGFDGFSAGDLSPDDCVVDSPAGLLEIL
jgi:phosphoglycolate phosphatase